MRHLDETFIDSISMSSLNVWVRHFPLFAESTRKKYCLHWKEEDEDTEEAGNTCNNQGSYDVCGLMDASFYEIARRGR